MTKAKTAKDWMQEFRPALDAAASSPDVSILETVELYIQKAIDHERQRCRTIAETSYEHWGFPHPVGVGIGKLIGKDDSGNWSKGGSNA